MKSPSTPVHPFDLLAVDGLLTDEEREIRRTVRTAADRELRPHIAGWFEKGEIPARELARTLGGLGVLGMHLEGYGCAGTGSVAYGLACLELEAVDSGLRSLVSVQGSLAMYAIWQYGSEEQKQRWLPKMAAGEYIGCFGLTEPDAGSDPGGDADQRSSATARTGCSTAPRCGSPTAPWPTSPLSGPARRTASGASSSRRAPRASAPPEIKMKLGPLRGERHQRTGPGGRAPPGRRRCSRRPAARAGRLLNEARFGIVFGALGAARDCLETAISYARDRTVFARSLASYQLTQQKLADMAVELGKGMLLALHLGRLKDAGAITAEQISVGKLNNVREAIAIARECRTILGANGITLEYPVLRHANNLESVLTYEGTSEVHSLVIGKALTGEQAFR
ncbi:glutaryl-CoA dehydrogenase [Streptomyces narbonensis]